MILPSGQLLFNTINKNLYTQKKNSSELNNNAIYFIYDDNTQDCQIAIGENIVSGEGIVIETEGTAINAGNANAVAGKAVYEAIQDVKDIIYCKSELEYTTQLNNGSNVGKLIYFVDELSNDYRLVFKFSINENYNLLKIVNNSYSPEAEDIASHKTISNALTTILETGSFTAPTDIVKANKFYANNEDNNLYYKTSKGNVFDLLVKPTDSYSKDSSDIASHKTIADALTTILEAGSFTDAESNAFEVNKFYANSEDNNLYYKTSQGNVFDLLERKTIVDLVEESDSDDATDVLNKLISNEARNFLLPADTTNGYKKEGNKVISAESRIIALEEFQTNVINAAYVSQVTSDAQSLKSDLELPTDKVLTIKTINHHAGEPLNIFSLSSDNSTYAISIDSNQINFGINVNMNASAFSLQGEDFDFETLEDDDILKGESDNTPLLSKRLSIEGNSILYVHDINNSNGLIKKLIDTERNSAINRENEIAQSAASAQAKANSNASAINNFLFIGDALPTEHTENIRLWIDTAASTNGVIKYRNIKEENGVPTEEWIAVNAVWG